MSIGAPGATVGPVRLDAQGLGRSFGRRYALRDVAFEAQGGQVVALVGHNGAGKSTLLQVLATRIAATHGGARLDGRPLVPGCPERVRVGYVSHQSFLYGALSCAENLELVARSYRRPIDGVDAALERVGLARAKDRVARELSRGMTQRLMIARLLLQRADVWLLDEPTTGLDAAGLAWLAGELHAAREAGRLVLASSHDGAFVAAVATHGLRLRAGRLTEAAPFDSQPVARWLRED